MPKSSRRISLEIDGEQGRPRGRVDEADGTSHEFDGWLALLTVLGLLIDDPAAGAEPSSPPTNSE